ncbi:hypothetical protein OIV83_000217 [Microbotryomycetes sp. JL201]|nr:hypothetical protein OIV83_000217 [Microbotryomycetes sp. JL201]
MSDLDIAPEPPHSRVDSYGPAARRSIKRTDTSSTVTGSSREAAYTSNSQRLELGHPLRLPTSSVKMGGISPRSVRVEASDDGDDEYSALEDADESRGRGRGRSRRREEDPVVKRSMLEDALRSSLATLLALSPHQSLSPAISSANLAALGAASPRRVSEDTSRKLSSLTKMSSPFAFALSEDQHDDEAPIPERDSAIFSDSSDNATQLAERTASSASRPIPIKSPEASAQHYRSSSDSLADGARPANFSPTASRPLLGPASASPPTWSRHRRRRRAGRRSSLSPPPAATIEERRRARGRGITDAEESERGEYEALLFVAAELRQSRTDQRFMDLVDNARAFIDAPPFAAASTSASLATTTGPLSLPDATVGRTSKPTPLKFAANSTPLSPTDAPLVPADWNQAPLSSPSSASFPSEPALASSVPAGELSSSPSRSPDGKNVSHEAKDALSSVVAPDPPPRGWFAWLSRTIEIKTWHLVGICGFAFGFGMSLGAR